MAERGEGPAPVEAVAAPGAEQTKTLRSEPVDVAVTRVNGQAKPSFQQAATEASLASNSLLKKIVGEANGASFEFYDMLKHAWPQANEQVEEVKQSQLNDLFLQVASFRDIDDAEKLRKKLVAMGLDTSIETGGSDSGARWFRVFVGPFTNEAKLKKVESTLTKMSFSPIPSSR
ncbi:MAG TPA: SPOR domain-containing protein [Pseudomonadales bacterium]|nr:SPOR domain-containing protein [Pseudomonadales bacterium]